MLTLLALPPRSLLTPVGKPQRRPSGHQPCIVLMRPCVKWPCLFDERPEPQVGRSKRSVRTLASLVSIDHDQPPRGGQVAAERRQGMAASHVDDRVVCLSPASRPSYALTYAANAPPMLPNTWSGRSPHGGIRLRRRTLT